MRWKNLHRRRKTALYSQQRRLRSMIDGLALEEARKFVDTLDLQMEMEIPHSIDLGMGFPRNMSSVRIKTNYISPQGRFCANFSIPNELLKEDPNTLRKICETFLQRVPYMLAAYLKNSYRKQFSRKSFNRIKAEYRIKLKEENIWQSNVA